MASIKKVKEITSGDTSGVKEGREMGNDWANSSERGKKKE